MEVNNVHIHKELDKIYGNINMNPGNTITQAQLYDSKITKNVISSEEQELCIFLYTIFQYYIEKATELMSQDEQDKKEKAEKIIKSLLESSFIHHFRSNKIIYACLNGILNFYLGLVNFGAEDQTTCEGPFIKALDFFNTLPTIIKIRYINIYQEIYNNLGMIYYNKGEIKKGLQNLGKAEQMYKVFNDLNGYNFTNSFSQFMKVCCSLTDNNGASVSNNEIDFFNFYIDGGLNKKSFEHNYTLTIFYYAQAFTKLGFRKKAIKYCSLALKRQIEFNEYELKDALVNCINLSYFYMENQHYAQAEYILISAMSLLPEDLNKKKKLRAALQNQLGKYFLERLKFASTQVKNNLFINQNEELSSIVNKRIFTFNTLNIVWPKIEDITEIEQAKILFRLANTQFKKALEFYTLDGYVTDHIQICENISQLYKYLIQFEPDNNRVFAMLERRINLLEPIYKVINHKVYLVQWQELSLELAEIYGEIFESNYELIRLGQKKVRVKDIDEINSRGEKCVYYYQDIIDYLVNEYNKEKEKNVDDFVTIITIKSNMARIISKLIYQKNVKKKVDAMKESLKLYMEVKDMLVNSPGLLKEHEELKENLKMCEEMVQMLPVKIDKINRGEEFN
jgi:tetratricopeptide (TPR) repeat protein